MIRKVVLFASLSLLTSCATPSSPPPDVKQPAPFAVDPRLCADARPEPTLPDGASIPQPVGEEEAAAAEKFLGWVQAALDWGRSYAATADVARTTLCRPTHQ